jgi:L-ascorbate 6-phosphate lactonase
MPGSGPEEIALMCRNDPFDRKAPVAMLVPRLMESRAFMDSIRAFQPPPDTLAVWFLGQNGFLLKHGAGPLIGIDLYLTNSCASLSADLPFRMDRQLPIFIEPEDLDVDVFATTHSHDDHADPETLCRMDRSRSLFLGPWDSVHRYRKCGVAEERCRLIHPGESVDLGNGVSVQATFALPTDTTDLNHSGLLFRFPGGITFYNTGDTAYAERLPSLLPSEVDICAICMNGGYYNLGPAQAAAVVHQIRPRVVIPCHYDMMVNNTGSPAMMHVALERLGSQAQFVVLPYYEPWLYRRAETEAVRRSSNPIGR